MIQLNIVQYIPIDCNKYWLLNNNNANLCIENGDNVSQYSLTTVIKLALNGAKSSTARKEVAKLKQYVQLLGDTDRLK